MKNFSFAKWLESDQQRLDPVAELQKIVQRIQRGISKSQAENAEISTVVDGIKNVVDKARSVVWDLLRYESPNSRGSKIWRTVTSLVGQMEQVLQQHGSPDGVMMSNPAHQYQPDDNTFAKLNAASSSGDRLRHSNLLGAWRKDHGDQPQQVRGTDDRVNKWIYSLAEEIERHINQLIDLARN
jgi:hypothetical protein